ncbi:hypothetical protein [Lactobacillus buchneri NRRL B-30929] [Lactiplantibacillus mudanjiangensis]|uniref:hypothetical protein n=1 Tax=Lactiplantibacillus mudanjiangensis TaxID=1296538 RepID=UPI001014248F|nr:hypothetical protein [Lactobacillus buchneri NRRL B-30929] [Lactiplantibacillus mudanjiangensis]
MRRQLLIMMSSPLILSMGVLTAQAATLTITNPAPKQAIPTSYGQNPKTDAYQGIQHQLVDSQQTTYQTSFYLPSYFSTADPHRNIYQGGVIVGQSLYLVESYHDDNTGNLVKLNLAAAKKLKLMTSQRGALASAYRYFDSKTTSGQQHLTTYQTGQAKLAKLKKQLKTNQTTLKKQTTQLKKTHKKATKQRLTKLVAKTKAAKKNLTAQRHTLTKQLKTAVFYKKVQAISTVGPTIQTGHGQALGYDTKHKRLFLYSSHATNPQLQAVNKTKLTTKTTYHATGTKPSVLTFDTSGNAYCGIFKGNNYYIYQSSYQGKTLKFALKLIIKNQMTDQNQGLSYNAHNQRLYLLGDAGWTSLPIKALKQKTLTAADLQNVTIKTTKEFENLTFDSQGYGYLTTLYSPELMKTTRPLP